MKGSLIGTALLVFGLWVSSVALADPAAGSADEKLEAISKKIDDQNRKIDLLSQEILKIEQQLANQRPGVMIGEGAPNYSPTATPSESVHASNGTSHIV